MWVQSLGWEDPLEEGMAIHSSILAWRILMDREAWRATVASVTESDRTEQRSTSQHIQVYTYVCVCVCVCTHTHIYLIPEDSKKQGIWIFHLLLQGVFPTQGPDPPHLHLLCRQASLYHCAPGSACYQTTSSCTEGFFLGEVSTVVFVFY